MKKVYPTMITPYCMNGDIDFGAVQALTEFYFEKGCDGIFAVCQSSEMFHLSLRERVALAKRVTSAANGRMHIVASGHVSSSAEDQIHELQAMADTGIDALILVSNRMARANESEEVWLSNADRLLRRLPENLPLGIYECPSPYKRLLSERVLKWCANSGRFSFIKDTCCDSKLIAERVKTLEGSQVKLYNANSLTLLESLRAGAAGFSGVMANFHPDLYVWLCRYFASQPELAEEVQSMLSFMSLIESSYPVCAKDYLNKRGISMTSLSRVQNDASYTENMKKLTNQMLNIEKLVRQMTDHT